MIDSLVMLYIALGLGVILCALIAWIFHLQSRINKLTRGKNGLSLENTITELIGEVGRIDKDNQKATNHRLELADKLTKSVRGVSTVRFNPFKDSGGSQSFATAMINEEGDGVIISTLFARERMSVFGKPIKKFSSQYDLSEEESRALAEARAQTS